MTSTDAAVRNTGRSLIPDSLFARLTARITADHHDIDQAMAERIMDQASAFLATAGYHTANLSPSKLVDIGWHTFILYTREYADFCVRVAGRFVHHEPHDPGHAVDQSNDVSPTLAAIETAGYVTDPALWTVAARCDQKCSASGKDGNENTETQIPPPLR